MRATSQSVRSQAVSSNDYLSRLRWWGSPNVLLLDEPTAGIDEPGEERLNELVHRLQQEQHLTVLLISHELAIVSRYATNVLCLSPGHAWFGPPKQILTPDLLHEMYGMPVAIHLHDA